MFQLNQQNHNLYKTSRTQNKSGEKEREQGEYIKRKT